MLAELLTSKNLTVATAESCTGGLLASTLTDVDGASAYVTGGVVAYSNAIKIFVLRVREETLQTFGAVSEQTARESRREGDETKWLNLNQCLAD